MKQLFLILLCGIFLTSCAPYYTRLNWSNLSLEEAKKVIDNGPKLGSVEDQSDIGSTLKVACNTGANTDIIKYLVSNGSDPTQCYLTAYYCRRHDSGDNIDNLLDLTRFLLEKDAPLYNEHITTLTHLYQQDTKKINQFLFRLKPEVVKSRILGKISNSPQKVDQIIKESGIQLTRGEIALAKLESSAMQDKRNSKEWYELIDQIKKDHAQKGIIGMSKTDYITKFGIPDSEYKINDNTIVLIYRKENRRNVPLTSSAHSFNNTNYYRNYFGNVNAYGSENTVITTSGGYVDIEQWQDEIYVDKGIVTGKNQKSKVTTN